MSHDKALYKCADTLLYFTLLYRQTDGRATAYSEREREFTFPKISLGKILSHFKQHFSLTSSFLRWRVRIYFSTASRLKFGDFHV